MGEEWEIRVTNEFLAWVDTLDERSKAQVVDAIDRLAEGGPALGRPWSIGWKVRRSTT
ncbi:hypothetical protein [Actinomadura sp. 6K520]|uniref:hypothetical protein n=1 Tax=Actinomadura sp. 6K520 TaxID=2530364 RepID=UPI0026B2E448